MKFVDTLSISVAGGKGGNGCLSFRREKFLPNGGPDGGNGGRGGSVVLEATPNLQTLADFERRRRFVADSGGHGEGNNRNGKAGPNLHLPVPCGTIVFDEESGDGLADLVEPGDRFVAARGGRGGRGNRVFASSRRRAPRFSEKGELGEDQRLRLELKLIADIGLVGLPNAGKSSILAAISGAAPKIADYPFTTLSPNLGVLKTDIESIVLADIPGLIEGASDNRGLGLAFLRHIERTRLLLHVLDASCGDAGQILEDWRVVRDELAKYDPELGQRPTVIIANKLDITENPSLLAEELRRLFAELGYDFIMISALRGDNVADLVQTVIEFARAHPRPKSEVRLFATVPDILDPARIRSGRRRDKIQIIALADGTFRILHSQIENASDRYDLSQPENQARFRRLLSKHRVEELLTEAGAAPGDTVSIGRMEFDFWPDDVSSTISDENGAEDEDSGE